MKIYTKKGDTGNTSLLTGQKVPKSHEQVAAYGDVDELNAFVGLLKDQDSVEARIKQQLYWIQESLFSLGSILAAGRDAEKYNLPKISEIEITQLENWIDHYTAKVPELKNFILPGGHVAVSHCHICRTICRRAERSAEKLNQLEEISENIIPFLNRLSDYFFILARKIGHDLEVPETPWLPKEES